ADLSYARAVAPAGGKRFGSRYWRRILAANLLASLAVTVVFSGVTWHTPPRRMAEAFAVALLFSFLIGPTLGIVMPHVGRSVASRFPFPFNWMVMIATMVGVAL